MLKEAAFTLSKEDNDDTLNESSQLVRGCSMGELETLKQVYDDLANELHESESALKNERLKVDDLAAKLSKLNIRNINKKER